MTNLLADTLATPMSNSAITGLWSDVTMRLHVYLHARAQRTQTAAAATAQKRQQQQEEEEEEGEEEEDADNNNNNNIINNKNNCDGDLHVETTWPPACCFPARPCCLLPCPALP